MCFPDYKPQEFEPAILEFWQKHKTLEKLRKKNEKGPKFYFLEGPPYTSGRVHLGTAWNMALKDMILRYKRMRGWKVWDRMGYDMHGLPTEQKVMAKLGLKDKEDIEKYGVGKFTAECEKFCVEMMQQMNLDFIRLGATLDFSNPYQPIGRKFMEAEWWLIQQAHKKGRLYQGLRTMHWDAATQTAVAKHELEYQQVTDTSLYLKFPHATRKKTFFIIWTTTPWTIPLNLAIMVNPALQYVEAEVEGETWILAKELAATVLAKAGKEKYTLKKEYQGKKLEGETYEHPLGIKKLLPAVLQKNKYLFTVVLSSEYVDVSAGTGLVHCAPGCGPEDYEVGHQYHLPPFNCVNEAGYFENFGEFSGWRAKVDDKKFIRAIEEAEALAAKESYTHDYPHGERSHQPVIFRTTKQWFFKVEDMKEKMLAANEKVSWQPEAGKNAFTAWLENLRDNSISRQRYWGTALPIWQAADGDYIVVGSVAELGKLAGQKIGKMHLPDIDQITITKGKKIYKRVPDVLDVWIDAGTVSWNCLDYPQEKKKFQELFPADFILEGKDQIRGWFNLLMVASFLAFDKPAFKNVYMHGFLNDVNGVKMSKSLGNIISPDELLQRHSADTLRYYMSQTNAGEDINFSWEECAAKEKNILIFWNVHKLLLNLAQEHELNPFTVKVKSLGTEEKYILSRLHSTIDQVTNLLEQYRLDEVIAPLEELFLELSRTYIQMIREKSALGTAKEKEACIWTIGTVLLEGLKMWGIVVPFAAEAMYQNLRQEFRLKEESISHYSWPKAEKKWIDVGLEQAMKLCGEIIQAGLSAREKAKLGLRWPVKEVVVLTSDLEVQRIAQKQETILLSQLNTKKVLVLKNLPGMKVMIKPNYAQIGPAYGKLAPQVIARLTADSPETILGHIEKEGAYGFVLEGMKIKITLDMLQVSNEVSIQYKEGQFPKGYVYVNVERTEELELEGYAREIMRHVQQMRKDAGLEKKDRITLKIQAALPGLKSFAAEIKEKVGAVHLEIGSREAAGAKEVKVKQEVVKIWLEKV